MHQRFEAGRDVDFTQEATKMETGSSTIRDCITKCVSQLPLRVRPFRNETERLRSNNSDYLSVIKYLCAK